MEKPLLFMEPMITALTLSKQWTGMAAHKFVEHLGEIGDRTEPSLEVLDRVADFPQPYWNERTVINPDTKEHMSYCLPWLTQKRDSDSVLREYWRKHIHHMSDRLSELFDEIVFKCEEVKRYEKNHPDVLYEPSDPDVAFGYCRNRNKKLIRMAELESQLNECKEEREKLRRISKAKKSEIDELKDRITQLESNISTTVNAEKWEKTVDAVLDVVVNTIVNSRKAWERDEFNRAIKEKYNEPHTKVLTLGWEKLPQLYRRKTGRPPKS